MVLFVESFYASCLSTFHIIYIVLLGILAKHYKVVDSHFEECLSKLITNVVLPCFVFAQIIQNFHLSQIEFIFEAFLGNIILSLIGLLIGYVSAKLLKARGNDARFLAALFSTPHTTSIPLILIEVINPVLTHTARAIPTDLSSDARTRGLLYIVLNSIFSNIWRWTVPYYLINPRKKKTELPDIEKPLLGDDKEKEKITEEKEKDKGKKEMTWRDIFNKIINMPLIASLLSLGITLIPYLHSFFNTPGALLTVSVLSVNKIVGRSYGFLVIFILGLHFSDIIFAKDKEENKKVAEKQANQQNNATTIVQKADEEKEIQKKPAEGIKKSLSRRDDVNWLMDPYILSYFTFVKLIIMPLIGCPIVLLVFRYWIHSDDVMTFLFLFMAAAPSAINLIIICSYKRAYVEEISMIMIVMYIVSIVTITFQVTLFIYIIGWLNS